MSALRQPREILTADEYLRMEVELFTRESTQQWTSVIYNEASDAVAIRSLNGTLTLGEIYEKVVFGE